MASSSSHKLTSVTSQVEELKQALRQNVELVVERGQQLEELDDAVLRLDHSAQRFSKQSRALRIKQWCLSNVPWLALVGFILLIIVVIIILATA